MHTKIRKRQAGEPLQFTGSYGPWAVLFTLKRGGYFIEVMHWEKLKIVVRRNDFNIGCALVVNGQVLVSSGGSRNNFYWDKLDTNLQLLSIPRLITNSQEVFVLVLVMLKS